MSPRLPNSIGKILEPPADLLAALLTLPSIAKQTQEMAVNTAPLRRVAESIEGVASDTEALPALQREMASVAKATTVMDGRMATIEAAMPTLVSVQQHLARVPDTLERLDARIDRLSNQLERFLVAVEKLGTSVETLQAAVEPLGRLAQRFPGRGRNG